MAYEDPADREIVGLIAASFAIGRVGAIVDIVRAICSHLVSPRRGLLEASQSALEQRFDRFVYRFYRSRDLVGLLVAMRRLIERHGSLEATFRSHLDDGSDGADYLPALDGFVSELYEVAPYPPRMISIPSRGSGCKRLLLFLRWMVRRDEVDPGCWEDVDSRRLLVPVDTHMLELAQRMGITARRSGGMRTTREITRFFSAVCPEDPVRYDFSLTRLGIHPDLSYDDLDSIRATLRIPS